MKLAIKITMALLEIIALLASLTAIILTFGQKWENSTLALWVSNLSLFSVAAIYYREK